MLLSVRLELHECGAVEFETGARDVVRLFRSLGGEFLTVRNPPAGQRIEEVDSEAENGLGLFLTFSHRVLEREFNVFEHFRNFDPVANLSYWKHSHKVCLVQTAPHYRSGPHKEPKRFDGIAMGQLGLGRLAYSVLRPAFAMIDEESYIEDSRVQRTEIKTIYWANFFGPGYVKKYGRKFLLKAPGWKTEELEDGGVLYVARESLSDWCLNKPREVLEYFKKQVPGVKLYKAVQKKY